MTRTLIAALWFLGLSLVARIAVQIMPMFLVWLAMAMMAAGVIGTILFFVALARAAWLRRPIPWSQWHRLGAIAGAVMFGLTVFGFLLRRAEPNCA